MWLLTPFIASGVRSQLANDEYGLRLLKGSLRGYLRGEESPFEFMVRYDAVTAVKRGHGDVARWLYTAMADFPGERVDSDDLIREQMCATAARTGDIDLLMWLRANGCPWGLYMCESAAESGHLDVLRWLVENGCPFFNACDSAAGAGHLEVLMWLVDNGAS
jgi:hypothetical protein